MGAGGSHPKISRIETVISLKFRFEILKLSCHNRTHKIELCIEKIINMQGLIQEGRGVVDWLATSFLDEKKTQ